jgi:hypothetical protein
MTVENLSTSVSVALGVLAATTGVIVSYLFTSSRPQKSHNVAASRPILTFEILKSGSARLDHAVAYRRFPG